MHICPSITPTSPPSSKRSPTCSRSRARIRSASAPTAMPRAPSVSLPRRRDILAERGDDLTKLPGIGADLAAKIHEIVADRALQPAGEAAPRDAARDHRAAQDPRAGAEAGQGAVPRARRRDCRTTARAQRRTDASAALPGFGAKTEQNILEAVQAHASRAAASSLPPRRNMRRRCAPICRRYPAWSRWSSPAASDACARPSAISTFWSPPA